MGDTGTFSKSPSRIIDGRPVISIFNARTHNLKNLDLQIPRESLVVITGPSGSGKSSLAIDTIFAEGQRQYIESLSVYSRQFFEQTSRTEVDLIQGLLPTICLDQNVGIANPRSTVATVAEIYDYLRVLMARVGNIHCCKCGQLVQQQTKEQICQTIQSLPQDTKVIVLAPIVVGRKGKHEQVFQTIRRERLVRVRIDGQIHDIDQLPDLDVRQNHTIEAVTDRIIVRDQTSNRLFESVELAEKLSGGLVAVNFRHPTSAQRNDEHSWQERVFSTRYACAKCDVSYPEIQPRTFSYNSPYGACETCSGLGVIASFDPDTVIPDHNVSISGGAIAAWNSLTGKRLLSSAKSLEPILNQLEFSADRPLKELKDQDWNVFLNQRLKSAPGLFVLLQKELATTTSERRLDELHSYEGHLLCHDCGGSRLNAAARSVTISGHSIAEITARPVEQLLGFFADLSFDTVRGQVAEPLIAEITKRLQFLNLVGVGYLTLNRAADSLSGGELQRVRLATAIGGGLTNVCYVLDEPSIGLHQRDNDRLIRAFRDLQSNGNSLLIVEHDEAMIRAADHIVDMGPSAGAQGGQVVAQGSLSDIENTPGSLTGDYLAGRRKIKVPDKRRRWAKGAAIRFTGAGGFNLKNIDVAIPLGVFVCVTGVSGSGKSTLINRTLAPAVNQHLGIKSEMAGKLQSVEGLQHVDKLIEINQKPIGRSPRGCAATYTGVFDEIRNIFAATKTARQRGFKASRFSFNTKAGWCADCQGYGARKISMNFLPDIMVPCEACAGRRFNLQTLQIRFAKFSIADVLEMSVTDALETFSNIPKIHRLLKSLEDVGLGYLPLGQPSTSLSGGEAQRIKLATELARKTEGHTLYLLDEPTTGLHFEDIRRLLGVLNQLVEKNDTVIVIEHNLDVIKCADWIIDLGPEGGELGGQIVATGTPEHVADISASYTGQYLRKLLK